MSPDELELLQRAADLIRNDYPQLSPEAVTCLLLILSRQMMTPIQVSVTMSLSLNTARPILEELSENQGIGLINIPNAGDNHGLIKLSIAGQTFLDHLAIVLRI